MLIQHGCLFQADGTVNVPQHIWMQEQRAMAHRPQRSRALRSAHGHVRTQHGTQPIVECSPGAILVQS
eukprot:2126893-Prymnesium_polylepis.1